MKNVENQLLNSIKVRFKDSGIFQQIKCELRTKVLEDIRCDDASTALNNKNQVHGNVTCPIEVSLSLINEFLEWMGFQYTKDMLATESGLTISSELFKMKVSEQYQNYRSDANLPAFINIVSRIICDNVGKGKKEVIEEEGRKINQTKDA